MPQFAIGWEYLTGYAVATSPSNRERAEWPPHPGRVFLALAAAYFEAGEEPAEGEALRWLEALGDPELVLPARDGIFERENVTAYVPVNDKAGPSAAALQSAPSVTRSKQARTFPRAWVGYSPCYMIWEKADGIETHRAALECLCKKVTRIGHSSSLVRMWIADAVAPAATERWCPDDVHAMAHCRVVSTNTLDSLPDQTNIRHIEQHAQLAQRIEASKGKELKSAKADYEQRFGTKWKRTAPPPPLLRPKLGIWRGYRPLRVAEPANDVPGTIFDTDLLVLSHSDGPELPLVSTLAVVAALRGTIMKHSGEQPVPAWVSGHEPNGAPQQSDDDAHLAIVPLPFVGHPHADGHLLGMGLGFPRSTARRQRGSVLGPLLLHEDGTRRDVRLKLGRLGEWTLSKRDWNEQRRALQPESWTAHPSGATVWASVTPVVLDKYPKANRQNDRVAWTEEVCDIVATACERIGLPRPVAVDIDTTSWHLGSSRAVQKQRALRGRPQTVEHATTGWGDGFPHYPPKGTNAPRPQTHVWLQFAEPVVGPVLLGAGRYRGYGLCMPVKGGRP
jgi:CRISPR-associated protein Csb2